MKSFIQGSGLAAEAVTFPRLMQHRKTGIVVMFTRPKVGFVVGTTDDSDSDIGYVSAKWKMSAFADFHGSVTIEV